MSEVRSGDRRREDNARRRERILGSTEANRSVVKRFDSSREARGESLACDRETHPGAGTRVTFGEAVVDFDASRAVGAGGSQGQPEHAAIARENFHSDRSKPVETR